ncbi:hypothetical protein [Streptomyces sp. NPDC051452]|uniref:hypothetical protein n=1 Tax=Streptomyces sp. NPDC051452 TaxID=3365654 RepID=UPI0037ABA7F9
MSRHVEVVPVVDVDRPGCSEVGCSRPSKWRGLCRSHYEQQRRAAVRAQRAAELAALAEWADTEPQPC